MSERATLHVRRFASVILLRGTRSFVSFVVVSSTTNFVIVLAYVPLHDLTNE